VLDFHRLEVIDTRAGCWNEVTWETFLNTRPDLIQQIKLIRSRAVGIEDESLTALSTSSIIFD
jgi:hypothetical protein